MPNVHLVTKLNEPSEAQRALPFYPLLPKTKAGILKWRIHCRLACLHDKAFRDTVLHACKQDVAFFAATFIYLHETRPLPGQPLGRFPLAPDCDQVDILAWLAQYTGRVDITVSKTRGIGLSYLFCIVLLWLWLFHGEKLEFALISKDETSLDMMGRPSSLMGKLDTMFESLPEWMKIDDSGASILNRVQTKHRFANKKNGNAIIGLVPTDDKLRSGRYFCVGLDEAAFLPADTQRWMAAAHGTSNSIVWISTFDGTGNTFFRITQDESPHVNVVRIESWFWSNPRWAAGLYKSEAGRIEILDKEFRFPENYPFSHADPGLLRSPLVDAAFCRPGADVTKVKEEVYGVAVQHGRKMFRPSVREKMERTCLIPVGKGTLDADGNWELDDLDGEWWLWRGWGVAGGPYAIGVDPSSGAAGGAFAGLVAVDCLTGEQIISAQLSGCDPVRAAKLAVAAAKLLAGPRGSGYCKINWEVTGGVGAAFSAEMDRLRWPALFYPNRHKTGKPGVHNSDRGESMLLEVGRAVDSGELVVRDKRTVEDLNSFEYDRDFKLTFSGTSGHGDLAIALAIAWAAAKGRRKSVLDAEKSEKGKTVADEISEWERTRSEFFYSDKFA